MRHRRDQNNTKSNDYPVAVAQHVDLIRVNRMGGAAIQSEFRGGVGQRRSIIGGRGRNDRIGPLDTVGHAVIRPICGISGKGRRKGVINDILGRKDVSEVDALDRAAGVVGDGDAHPGPAACRLG